MNTTYFYNSFRFNSYCFSHSHFTDNSAGIRLNYLAYMTAGRGTLVTDSKKLEVTAGDIFYIPGGLKYQSYWESDDIVSWDSYGFEVLPEKSGICLSLQKLTPDESMREQLALLSSDKTVSCRSVGLLYTIFGSLLSKMELADNGADFQIMKTVSECFETNPHCKIEEVAKACQYSVPGLYSYFSRHLGTTPNAIRHRILRQKAKALLTTTNMPIEEISEVLGFSSSSYFRKFLRSETGMTPTEIRKESQF